MIQIEINRNQHQIDVLPETSLLWVLSDKLKLHGTKYGCGIEQCGACRVHVGGRQVPSCGITVVEAAGKSITTIEGLPQDLRPGGRWSGSGYFRNAETLLSRRGTGSEHIPLLGDSAQYH